MLDLDSISRIHFTGIKGVGMAGLAMIARQMGRQITGSDIEEIFITDTVLARNGIQPLVGFDPQRVEQADLVIASGAHGGRTNPEVQYALRAGIPVLMHAEALGLFSKGYKVIAVAGCHGKTTTAAMIAWILEKAGYDPCFAIGTSEITGWGFAAKYGKGEYFVIEADEYMTCPHTDPTPRFLYLDPFITVVTNIEHDHPDRYADIEETKQAFNQLLNKNHPQGCCIAGIDNAHVRQLVIAITSNFKLITYGTSESADYRVSDFRSEPGQIHWDIRHLDQIESMRLSIPGFHNALNATAAAAVGAYIGVSASEISEHLRGFRGLKRRFELKGEVRGIRLYDDYAHHPTEIRATLKAAREWFPRQRIVAIFQSHTYSRTQVLFDDFGQAFENADIVIIPRIFPSAREMPDREMNAEVLSRGIARYHTQVLHLETFDQVVDWLKANARSGDIIFTLGAGDVYHAGEQYIQTTAGQV